MLSSEADVQETADVVTEVSPKQSLKPPPPRCSHLASSEWEIGARGVRAFWDLHHQLDTSAGSEPTCRACQMPRSA